MTFHAFHFPVLKIVVLALCCRVISLIFKRILKNFHNSVLKVKVTQSCPTLCDPVDYTINGILQARILEWVDFPFSRVLPNPATEPRSPALQADSLPAEPQGKPKNNEVGSDPFSSGSSGPRNWTRVSCIAGRFFTNRGVRYKIKENN